VNQALLTSFFRPSTPASTEETKPKLPASISSLKTIDGYAFKQRSLAPN